MSSYKTRLGAIATALCVLSLAGCSSTERTAGADSNFADSAPKEVREPGADRDLDFGGNWDDRWIDDLAKAGGSAAGRGEPGSAKASSAKASAAKASQRSIGGVSPAARRAYWSVLLGSYTAQNHRQAAANMIRSCAQIDPRLGRAHVHSTAKGSIVLFGNYEDAQSESAQRDLAWIKDLEMRGRTVFPRAILNRVSVGTDPDRAHPLALVSVRQRYPDLNPLYTLEVAVWGDFDSGKLSPDEVRERGMSYARELRSQGNEAYFHYDDNTGLCMVTVSLFDRTAIDAQSGLLSPEVESLLKKFPAHLVNGELLHEPVDARRPHLGTRVQTPRLVMVPK